ncbi:unknown [Alistipes sp. CAG:157]|nr:unknown [Alistipes sp. CAG:157]
MNFPFLYDTPINNLVVWIAFGLTEADTPS